jgi:GNAT superfamily N-acetyltransferase
VLDVTSIPPALRTVRDPALARIEDATLTASQPREQVFYDGWLLRYANGKAKRARSVNLTGPGELPLEEKLAHCADFYARRGVPLIFRLTPFSQPPGVDLALARAGFVAAEETRVMVLELGEAHTVPAPPAEYTTLDPAGFGAAVASLHGLDPQRAEVERDRLARSPLDGIYLAVRDGERIIACGSAAIDSERAGVFNMVTAPERRGLGLATGIVGELLRQARARGCITGYLQVDAGNAPARHVYSKFGFRDGYAYWYRLPPAAEETER